MLRRTLALASLLALAACDKKEAAPTTASTAQAAASTGTSAGAPAKDAPASAPVPTGGNSAALSHLPSNCDTIARIDLAKVLAMPAVKAHVAPALEDMKKSAPSSESDKNFRAFIADAGIDPLTDIKEIAMCAKGIGPGGMGQGPSNQFTLVLGGSFKPGAVIPAREKNGKKDALSTEDLGGTKIAVAKDGSTVIGQAADGAVVIAGDKASLEAALKGGADGSKLGLPTDAAIAFVMPAEAMKKAMATPGTPFGAQAAKAGRALLTVDLARPALQLRIGMTDDAAATELAGALKLILGQMTSQPVPPGDPSAGLVAMAKEAKISSAAGETVVDVAIPAGQIDELGKQLAEVIRGGGPVAPTK
jgi:hypothetical protein